MKSKLLLTRLSKLFPKKYAKLFHDRVGLMTGKLPENINRIVLCLDFDDTIFEEAMKVKPDIIITHHPFIYGPRAKVLKNDQYKKDLCDKLDNVGVPVYSFHTNFDTGRKGMNDALAEALGLTNVYAPESEIIMRCGELKEPMPVEDFAKFAKKAFKVDYSLLVAYGNPIIKKVGLIGGGGARYWTKARDEGCDIYISGDAPHYVRRDIVTRGYNYLDMPHEIERIFMQQMHKIIKEIDKNIEVIEINHEILPKVI